ncbi:aminopeptidase [Bacteroidetes/Chlorobi group bacterium ChocPot_Mid]|jgi:leucyl aminopeptidase (aminopeptidase T)|nr:MAG: aminopeptidase [Bacteroidetes/Chlorobi group bacterium ChocPot_Mid]
MARPSKIKQAVRTALVDYLGLTEDETLLVITDEHLRDIGMEIYETSKTLCAESIFLEMSARKFNGEEPPDAVAEIMKSVDAVISPTSKSLTHTKSKREASKLGVRIATMPGITRDTLIRCLSADPQKIMEVTELVAQKLHDVNNIRVKTELGTDITLPVRRRRIMSSTGILRNIGDTGNLPSGEVFMAPVEDETSGVVVFDGSIGGIGLLSEPVRVEISKGYIKKIKGGKEAQQFEEMLKGVHNEKAFAVAEFGMGTNYAATLTGQILEDEKILGTIHIAFGNNLTMGGKIKVASHVDGLVMKPDVYFDKELVMSKGKLLIKE